MPYKFTVNLRNVQRHRTELLIRLYQTIQHHGQERTNTLRVLFCQSRQIDLTEQCLPWKAKITQLLKKFPPLQRTRSLLRCSQEPVNGLHFVPKEVSSLPITLTLSYCPIYVLPSGSLPPFSPTKMPKALSSPTFMLRVHQSYSPCFDHRNNIYWIIKVMKLLVSG